MRLVWVSASPPNTSHSSWEQLAAGWGDAGDIPAPGAVLPGRDGQ